MNMLCRLTLAAAAVSALGPAARADDEFDPAVYERAVRSCVFLVTPKKGGFNEGSGALIDVDRRLVITTSRAVGDEGITFVEFPVRLQGGGWMTNKKDYVARIPVGQALKGRIVARDSVRDLALVQLDRLPTGTPALPLATDRVMGRVRASDAVLHIGSPAAANKVFTPAVHTVTSVATEEVTIPVAGTSLRLRCRVVTTASEAAADDSGGPLIDAHGRLVGLLKGGAVGDAPGNVYRSVAASEVRAFLEENAWHLDAPPPDPRPGPVAAPAAAGGTEQAAADLLKRASIFAGDPENRDYYRARLREIIKKYPETAAAKEAKKVLERVK